MNKPTKVKIGSLDYAVNWVDAEWSLNTDRRGSINYVKEEITVGLWLSPFQMAETFLHEVTHAIIVHFSRTSTEPIAREDVSEWVGAGLVMVWRDNPEAFEWWNGLIAGKVSK